MYSIRKTFRKWIGAKYRMISLRWALKQRNKTLGELTEFELNFVKFLRKTVVSQDTELFYSVRTGSRIVYNQRANLCIVIHNGSVKIKDDSNIVQFVTNLPLNNRIDDIFDRANRSRCESIERLAEDLMLKSIKEMERDFEKRGIEPQKVTRILHRRRSHYRFVKENLEGA